MPKNYQHVLASIFAINEINKDATLLPNITLGSWIFDNNFNPSSAIGNTFNLLFMGQAHIPNYDCVRNKKFLAAIGGLTSQNSIQMANSLNIYKTPQVPVYSGIAIVPKSWENSLSKPSFDSVILKIKFKKRYISTLKYAFSLLIQSFQPNAGSVKRILELIFICGGIVKWWKEYGKWCSKK